MLNILDLDFFNDCVNDILKCEIAMLMDSHSQHGSMTCLEHSIFVAYCSYWVCKKFKLHVDFKSLIRGALLHDFFIYDRRETEHNSYQRLRKHPKEAYKNAAEHFEINDVEKDIIIKHMWPITIRPPKYLESYIVNAMDTFCASVEALHMYKKVFSKRVRYSAN